MDVDSTCLLDGVSKLTFLLLEAVLILGRVVLVLVLVSREGRIVFWLCSLRGGMVLSGEGTLLSTL